MNTDRIKEALAEILADLPVDLVEAIRLRAEDRAGTDTPLEEAHYTIMGMCDDLMAEVE